LTDEEHLHIAKRNYLSKKGKITFLNDKNSIENSENLVLVIDKDLVNDNLNYSSPYLTTKTLLMYYGFIEYQFKKNISFTNFNSHFDKLFRSKSMDMDVRIFGK
jgi:hypothetical protein